MMRIIVFICLTLTGIGCATHISPIQEENKFIFVTDDEPAIFNAAFNAMLEGSSDSPITELTGPIRGYQMTRRIAVDSWTTNLRIFPATGTSPEGKILTGYYPEVSGDGTLLVDGASTDKEIYNAALRLFGDVAKRETVTNINRGQYVLERDLWRLNSRPSKREPDSINETKGDSVSNRLEELSTLKESGAITEKEYDELRLKILNDL